MNRHAILAFVAVQLIAITGFAQISSPPRAPLRQEAMRILDAGGPRITVGGNIVFQFPNYDISIGGTPEYAGLGNGRLRFDPNDPTSTEQVSTRVIYKSPNGSWDGANFLLNPSYSYSYANNYYRNRFINSGKRADSDPNGDCFPAPYQVWTARYEPPRLDEESLETPADPFARHYGDGTVKSEETLGRLYQSRPSFVYSPTPIPPRPPTPTPPRESDSEKNEPKQLLWQLDQSFRSSTETWAIRQAESTARNRRKLRPSRSISQVPKRLSPEPPAEGKSETGSEN